MVMRHNHQELMQQPKTSKTDFELRKIFTTCKRFTDTEYDHDYKKSLIFLKLLEQNVPKRQAVNFCQKRVCKSDSTASKDGPSKHRILKQIFTEKPPTLNGWCSPKTINYDMGNVYVTSSIKSILKENDSDQLMQDRFTSNEAKIKDDFKGRIATLTTFLADINNKYDLTYSSLGRAKFRDKLKELQIENLLLRKQPLKYIKHHGQKYFELVDEYEKQLTDKGGSLSDLNPFQSPIAFPNYRLRQKEKLRGDIFSRLRGTKTEHQNDLDVDQQRSSIKRLQSQSNFVLKLHESDGVCDAQVKGNMKIKTKVQNAQILLEEVGSSPEEKQVLAYQFNKSQYFFKVDQPLDINRVHMTDSQHQISMRDVQQSGDSSPTRNSVIKSRKFRINQFKIKVKMLDLIHQNQPISKDADCIFRTPLKSTTTIELSPLNLRDMRRRCSIKMTSEFQEDDPTTSTNSHKVGKSLFEKKLDMFVRSSLDTTNRKQTEPDFSELLSIKQRNDSAIQKLQNKIYKVSGGASSLLNLKFRPKKK